MDLSACDFYRVAPFSLLSFSRTHVTQNGHMRRRLHLCTILFAMARFAALVSAYVSASAVKHVCEQYARARSSESTTFALSSNLTTVSHVWHSKSARTCSLRARARRADLRDCFRPRHANFKFTAATCTSSNEDSHFLACARDSQRSARSARIGARARRTTRRRRGCGRGLR